MIGVLLKLAVLLCILNAGEGKVSDAVKVVLPHGGGVIGTYMTSHRGRGILAFHGIPFAEPPVGPLRFANPQPKRPWTDYIETKVDNKMCPQPGPFAQMMRTDEDCLHLNVFTPSVIFQLSNGCNSETNSILSL